jgi:glyceraldehyde 3-phosphate dehydrogenase
MTAEKDPARLPWRDLGVDLVVEATGIFRSRDAAAKHVEAGAKRVVITAPGKGVDATICMGVNHTSYDPVLHQVVSNASCTTNCLAPVVRVLHERFGLLTTVHAYTSSQGIVDAPHKKWRRGRAGAANIVPTSTGAAIATTEVLPELEGRLDGMAIRVPVPCGSITDLVVQTDKPVSVESVNQAFRDASTDDSYAGVLAVSDDELVSQDVVGQPSSALVDLPSTMTLGDTTAKVLAWYDNELGYAHRVVDLAVHMLGRGA